MVAFLSSPLGVDVEKISDFQGGQYVHMVAFFRHHLMRAMLRKLAIFKSGKYVHMVAFFGITSWGDVETQLFFDNMGGDVTQNDGFHT